MKLSQANSAWNRFWFAPQLPTSLPLFRIAIGLIVVYLYFLIAPNANQLYGKAGLVSTPINQFSMFLFCPTDNCLQFSLVALLIAGVFLTLGLFSRLSALCIFLILLSLDSLNHFVFHPAFSLLRVMALYLSFSRCGDAFSVDRIIKTWRTGTEPEPSAPWAQRLMQLQVVAVYWAALSFQINGTAWLDGSAVYYATHLSEFQRFPVSFFDNLTVCQITGIATMLIELSLCTLVWVKEFRYIVLFLGLALHLGIEYTMVFIPLMQPLMIASYLLFIDPDDLAQFIRWGRSKCSAQ